MRHLIVALLIAIPSVALAQDSTLYPAQEPGLSQAGGTLSGTLAGTSATFSGTVSSAGGTLTGNVKLQCALCQIDAVARTSDALPYAVLVQAGDAWPQASTAANKVGGNLVLAPGIGAKLATITDYTKLVGGNDVYTVTVTTRAGATASTCTAVAAAPGANQFLCATSNDSCATQLAACIDALAGVEASASSAVVYVTPDSATIGALVSVADGGADGAIGTATNNADGQVLLPIGSASLSSVAAASDADTGVSWTGTNGLSLNAGGSQKVLVAATVYFNSNTDFQNNTLLSTGGLKIQIGQADLSAGSCTANQLALDTGGATKELCFCQATNTWYCMPFATLTGPAD